MKSLKLAILAVISTILIGCGGNSVVIDDNKNEIDITKDNDNIVEERDEIKEKIRSMTLEEKIGQLFVVGFEGETVNDEVTDLVSNKHVGGVILFARNVVDSSQLISLNSELRNIEDDIPLFISVDEEGGLVSRVPEQFIKLPSSGEIGEYNSEELCYKVGGVIAKELNYLGFNMDFAPVLDINSNPNNTVIGERAFGDNASIVSKLGIKTMEGIKDGGIIPVVKHFPGHGDTDVDSHYGLPIVSKTLEELNNLEFVPFKNAIDKGADVVMVSSIVLSTIDNENPSTMSKKVMTDILRGDLGFNGVIATDDMTMGAIMDNYDLGQAVVASINAGGDLILVCHGYDNIINSIEAVNEAVHNGSITEERINDSVYRVLKLKEKYNINQNEAEENIDINSINSEIKSLFN